MSKTFLSGEWRKLVMFNYSVDPTLLTDYIPKGTKIDLWNNTCYVSLVGFMFMNTKLKGIPIPFHKNFEEINLRFYITYEENGITKRGVVFIKEIVPKPALTFVANSIYNEKYETLKMKHNWKNENQQLEISYAAKRNDWQTFSITTNEIPKEIEQGSEAEFITEHNWGYSKINENQTNEYEVKHPRWKVYETLNYSLDFNFEEMYGNEFKLLNSLKPISVFLAEGSEIEVMNVKKIIY